MVADTLADKVEQLVDQTCLGDVVAALRDVCGAKAAHLREAWQDEASALSWDRAAVLLDRCLAKLPI